MTRFHRDFTTMPVIARGTFVMVALLLLSAAMIIGGTVYAEHIHTNPQDVYDKMPGSDENARNIIVGMEERCHSRLQNASGSTIRRKINNSIPYDHKEWISRKNNPSNINIIAESNEEVELQLNSMAFYCAIVVENSHLKPGIQRDPTAVVSHNPGHFPRDRHPITHSSGPNNNNEASYSARYTKVKSTSVDSGSSGHIVNSPDGDTFETNRKGTRYSFALAPPITYDTGNVSKSETVKMTVKAKRIVEFHGNEYYCQSPRKRVSGPNDFNSCDTLSIDFSFDVIVEESDSRIQGQKEARGGVKQKNIDDQRVYIDGGANGSSTSNPFSFKVPAGKRRVSVNGNGYDVDYEYCVGQIVAKCNSSTAGNGSSFTVNAPEDNFVDVRFYFSKKSKTGATIRGEKVNKQHNVVPAEPWHNNRVTAKSSSDFYASQNNPFRFKDVAAPRNYKISVEGESGYTVSWMFCRGSGSVNEVQSNGTCTDGSSANNGNGSSFSTTVPPGDIIDVHFIFEKGPGGGNKQEKAKEKVYGANYIDIEQDYMRDNSDFDIDVKTYLWPNAGMRGGVLNPIRFTSNNLSNTKRFWLAGIWGESSQDLVGTEGSERTNPNAMTKFNIEAQANCPNDDDCLQRVPMAYVPARDGSGEPATYSQNEDGSRTKNGNRWHEIREERQGSHSNNPVTSCGNYTTRYNPRCGGIASSKNMNLYGARGNHIKDVEISNIRIRAHNPDALLADRASNLQGMVNGDLLQPHADKNKNLPSGSQGPEEKNSPAWDNIRQPDTGLLRDQITNQRFIFPNVGGGSGLPNFTDDPEDMDRRKYKSRSIQYGEVTATTLLQDGNDTDKQPYEKKSEPVTYTATLNELDRVDLVWDEYADWSQADDKGHWYPERGRVPTGIDRGLSETETFTLYNVNRGSRESFGHKHCTTDSNGNTTCTTHTHYTKCTGSYPTKISYKPNTMSYYADGDSPESRFGWLNNSPFIRTRPTRYTPSPTHFYPRPGSQPFWSNTTVMRYWQDVELTEMENNGSSIKPEHEQRWIYDTSDPVYTDRHVFNDPRTPDFDVDAYADGQQCTYPNGSASAYSETSEEYYPDAERLYENSTFARGRVYGKYNFRYDGTKDGTVDSDWAWSTNWQRVRYEQTYTDRFRKLGPRSRDGSGKYRLYGVAPDDAIRAGRDNASIYNPVVETGDGDVFAGGNLHSYFVNSDANSAFLFSNNEINKFDSDKRKFPGYYIHEFKNRVNAYYPSSGGIAAVEHIFRDYDDLRDRAETLSVSTCEASGSADYTGSFDLERGDSSIHDNVYLSDGDLRVGPTEFKNTAGTIIVEGDLCIDGNITYGSANQERESVPSVGFIVKGHIVIDEDVDTVHGSYFSGGEIYTGSRLLNLEGVDSNRSRVQWSPNNERDPNINDDPLGVNGLMIARSYVLARQPSGRTNQSGASAEKFIYDGRVVVNPPPGFSRVFTADAIWNDTVPRN